MKCHKCGSMDGVRVYNPQWKNGAVAKCFVVWCKKCLADAQKRHPDIIYKTKENV